MTKKLGICVPVRPYPGQAGFDTPGRWGCLRPGIHDPLMEELRSQTDAEILEADFRDGYILNGEVWVGELNLSTLDAYFWYCEVDREPGSYHLELLKALAQKIPVSPDPWKWEQAVDKYNAHNSLNRAKIALPDYLLFDAENLAQVEPVLEAWGAAMLKPRRGAWGKGVHLVESFSALRDLVGYIMSVAGKSPDRGFLLERYHTNDMNRWVSITVLGGEIMYGYRKKSSKIVQIGDGRFKVFDEGEKGGEVTNGEIDAVQREMALKAAAQLDCPIIGFDMIWTDEGPLIVDENTSPGNYPDLYAEVGKDPAKEFARVILNTLS